MFILFIWMGAEEAGVVSAKSRGIKHGELFQDKLHESYTVESQILFLFVLDF